MFENIKKKTVLINRTNLLNNLKIIKKRAINSKIVPVIKGDAYGHGIAECCQILLSSKVKSFYVARLEDAIKIRKIAKDIQIIFLAGPVSKNCCNLIQSNKLIPVINNLDQLKLFNEYIKHSNFILHFDSGMNRLGFSSTDLLKSLPLINSKKVTMLMSHFSSADDMDLDECNLQLQKLKKINKYFKVPLSISNSAGIFLSKKFHLDFVRPGKSLYGVKPFNSNSFGLKQVMSVYAPIIQISLIKKNQSIGYSRTFRSKKNIKTATIDIGYGDGLFRYGSNKINVYIDSFICKVIGRISMDLIVIDITDIPENKLYLGKPVEILGMNQTCESLSKQISTNEHEVLISLGKNANRIYY